MYVYVSLGIRSPYSLFYEGAKKTPVTCVYCRSPWVNPETAAASASSGSTRREGYLNMSSAAGISDTRDESSCESCNGSGNCRLWRVFIQYVLDYHYRQYSSYGCRNYY